MSDAFPGDRDRGYRAKEDDYPVMANDAPYRGKSSDYHEVDNYRNDPPSYRSDPPKEGPNGRHSYDSDMYRKDENYRKEPSSHRKDDMYRKDDSYRKESSYRKEEPIYKSEYKKEPKNEYKKEPKNDYKNHDYRRSHSGERVRSRSKSQRAEQIDLTKNSSSIRDAPKGSSRSNHGAYDDLPSPPPRKRANSKHSPDILEVKEIKQPSRKLSSDRKMSSDRARRRSRSRDRPPKSRRSRTPEKRRPMARRTRSRSPPRAGRFKPALDGHGDKHYLARSPVRETPVTIVHRKPDPNDFFNDELKKAITAGRIKMTERELLVDGPNYSHTTNGKEEMYQKCRIFVGHLPVDFLSKDDIYYIFEKYGKILAISLHKGFAFLQFKNPEMAELAATSENGRRVKGACLEVNLATISKDEARKLPREGATLPPLHRGTPQCRLYMETEHDRMYACQIERKLRALGITVDSTIWKETSRKSRYHGLDDHLVEMQTDPDSICAIQVCKEDIKRKTATVHIFKNDLEEHRNMPIVEALILVQNRVEKLRKLDEPPPGRIGSIMRIIAEGRMATLLEVEQVIEWLEEKRLKLGGRKRKYETDAATEKLKDSISQIFGPIKSGPAAAGPRGGAAPSRASASREPAIPPPVPRNQYEPGNVAVSAPIGARQSAPSSQNDYRPAPAPAYDYHGSRDVPHRDNGPPVMQQTPYQSYSRNHYDAAPAPAGGGGPAPSNMERYAPSGPTPRSSYPASNNVIYGGGRPTNNPPSASYDDSYRNPPQQSSQYSHSGYY